MAKITALKQQHKNKERVSVFLDDEFAFGLPMIVAQLNGLRKGDELTEDRIQQLRYEASVEAGKSSAERFISYRPRSVSETRKNLTKKGYEPDIIDIVIEWCHKVHILDDSAFARFWVEQRETFKPRSQYAMRQELRQKGVDSDVIDVAIAVTDEVVSARKAATKRIERYRHLEKREFNEKLGRYLQGRGFHYGVIRQVLDEIHDSIEEEKRGQEDLSNAIFDDGISAEENPTT